MRQMNKQKTAPSNTRTRGRKQPVRLKIESMEDRTVPAAVPLLPNQHFLGAGQEDKTALIGNTLYFSAGNANGSSAMWQTDGTATGTSAVVNGAVEGLSPIEVTSFNGKVYFTAADANGRINLFQYNPASDTALTPLTQVPAGTNISEIHPAYNRVYFWATGTNEGQTTQTLMMVDMNDNVTTVRQFNGGIVDVAGSEAVGTRLYFRAATAPGQPMSQLWHSDGLPHGDGINDGTKPIVGTGTQYANDRPQALVPADGKLFFTATDGTGVTRLWAAKATNLNPLNIGGIDNLTAGAGGIAVFTATGEYGTIIGMSDGTRQGTLPIADASRFPTTLDRSTIDNLIVARSAVYFTANETSTGNELWMAQGNIVSLVADIEPGTASSNPTPLANVRETLYFSANTQATGTSLYATDGTTQGTGIAAALDAASNRPGAGFVEVVNNRVVVGATPTGNIGTLATRATDRAAERVEDEHSSAQLFALSGTPVNPDRTTPPAATFGLGISAASSNVAYGDGVTLSVTVTPQTGSPAATGRVQIYDNGTQVGSANIGPNGLAVWTSSTTIRPGAHSFSARYTNGDNTFASSQVDVTVRSIATTTNIVSSASTTTPGQAVTFTATVGGTELPTAGTVTFRSGNTVIGTAQVNGRTAVLTVNNLAAGGYQVTATYEGNGPLGSSTSYPVALTVVGQQIGTQIRLAASASTINAGQPVTLTATVFAGGGYYPTGTVTFTDGTTVLGTAQLDAAQQARLTVSNLSAGGHAITATYGGSAMFLASTSPVRNVNVDQQNNQRIATDVRLSSSVTTTNANQPVTLSAFVISTMNKGVLPPGGTVTFRVGKVVIGTSQVVNGEANLTTTFAIRGVHAVTATYSGTSTFAEGTSRSTYITVRGLDVTANLTVEGRQGQATLTAVLRQSDSRSGVPTGRVVFFDGATQLGSVEVVNGRAAWTGATGYGPRTFRAVFQGSGAFNDISSPSVNYSIRYPVSIALNAPLPPANGLSTFTVTVTPLTPGAPPANGRVTFMEGSTQLATVAVINGVAQIRVGDNGQSYRYFTAVYQGGDLYESGTPTPVVYGTPTGTSTDRVAPMPKVESVHQVSQAI